MADLLYFDKAFLYIKYDDDPASIRWSKKYLNFTPKNGGARIPDELPKEEREVMLIERAKNEVKKSMRFFNRNKMIDIPMSMIYIVPQKTKYSTSFLKGVAVERNSSDCLFIAKVFQEIFLRTSFCQVVSDKNRKPFYVDGGTAIFKRGIASLLAREFVKQSIAEKLIEDDDFSEEWFDRDSEEAFNLFLEDFYSNNKTFSKKECFDILVEAVINEESFLKIAQNKKADSIGSMSFSWSEKEQKVLSSN